MNVMLVDDEIVECRSGEWHADLLTRYMAENGISEIVMNAMIEDGRVKFGDARMSSSGKLEFVSSWWRDMEYTSIKGVMDNARQDG